MSEYKSPFIPQELPIHDEQALMECYQTFEKLLKKHPELTGKITFGQYYLSQDLTLLTEQLEDIRNALASTE
jgi:hypothetical protein